MNQGNNNRNNEFEFEIEDLSIDDGKIELEVKQDQSVGNGTVYNPSDEESISLSDEDLQTNDSNDSLVDESNDNDGNLDSSNQESANEDLLEEQSTSDSQEFDGQEGESLDNNENYNSSDTEGEDVKRGNLDKEKDDSSDKKPKSDLQEPNEQKNETSDNNEKSNSNNHQNDEAKQSDSNKKDDDFKDSNKRESSNQNKNKKDDDRNPMINKANDKGPKNALDNKRQGLKDKWNNRPKTPKDFANKAKSGIKNKAQNRFNNSKLGQTVNKGKNAIDKGKKAINGTKKAGKFVAKHGKKAVKTVKAIATFIKAAIAAAPVAIAVLAIIVVVVCIFALLPGSKGSSSNDYSKYSKADQKTLTKMKKIFDEYPNADGTLLLSTMNYPYFNILWSSNVSKGISQEYSDQFSEEEAEVEEGDDTEEVQKEDKVGDDLFLEIFKKYSYRKKLKKLAKKLSEEGETAYFEYLKSDYFESEKAYKSMLSGVSNADELKNLIIEDIKNNKNYFLNYVYNSYSCSANLLSTGSVEIEDMLKGNILVDVKVSSCTTSSNVWDCESIYSSPITLEKYAKGGTYKEFNTMDVEKAAAQMIAIKSFVASRSKNMGWGVKQDENGNTIVTVRNNTNDLVYCDIDSDCNSGNPISDEQRKVFDQAWDKAKNVYIYNKENTQTVGSFCQSRSGVCDFCKKGNCLSHEELKNYTNTDYNTILTDQYSALQLIMVDDGLASGVISNGISCTGSQADVDDSNFVYYAQTDYKNIAFCGLEKGAIKYYGCNSNSICTAGCGLTSMAMVTATLTQNTNIDPPFLNGEIRPGTDCGSPVGTYGSNMFPYVGEKYGLTVNTIGRTKDDIKKTLDEGALIITSVCHGLQANNTYTMGECGGHIIVVRGYEDNNVIISDPFQNEALKNYGNCLSKRSDGACTKFSMNFDSFMNDLNTKNATVYKIAGPTPFYNLTKTNQTSQEIK